MAVVGPGAVQEQVQDITSMLDGASEYEYVTILNPLTDDFAVRVAQDIPVNMPFEVAGKTSLVQNESDVIRNYGLGLKNPDFQARKHIVNDTIIPSGQTINLKGNEAQVAVRQLVNELMQREGNGRLMSDPHLRADAEKRIVRNRGSIQSLMDGNVSSIQAQMNDAITKSNEGIHEQTTTGLSEQPVDTAHTAGGNTGSESVQPQRRTPGRPKQIR